MFDCFLEAPNDYELCITIETFLGRFFEYVKQFNCNDTLASKAISLVNDWILCNDQINRLVTL